MKEAILEFIEKVKNKDIEIYNEASVQYELAIFLRDEMPEMKIQLERNIGYFGLGKKKIQEKRNGYSGF